MIEMKIDKSSKAFIEVEINDDLLDLGIKYGRQILDAVIFFDSLPLDNNTLQQFAIYINKHCLIDYNQEKSTLTLNEVAYE